MKMMGMVARIVRRQFQTIVSREIIKPSFPTPSHLKTYNLSLFDQISANIFMPMVVFYPNASDGRSHDKVGDLKNSLSKTLTKYYPFAGRYKKIAPSYVDCNDDGVEFMEVSIQGTLSKFLQNSQHEDLEELFPHVLLNLKYQSEKGIPLSVQSNHFECGGVALAVSLSHKIADASSLCYFVNDWAKMTKFCSSSTNDMQKEDFPIDPHFISFPLINKNFDGFSLEKSKDFVVTRSFIFSNSKINDLKRKVTVMTAESGQPIANPTRVQVLTWLLYKCGVAVATKNNLGVFKPTSMVYLVNIRDKMMEPLPTNSIGNIRMRMQISTNNENELKPEVFISELNKQKMEVQHLKNIETAFSLVSETALKEEQRKIDGAYICTSMCGFDAYEIDFGWGKPVKATVAGSFLRKNSFLLMDAPNKSGIEVLVCMVKEDMTIFQRDPELLCFC